MSRLLTQILLREIAEVRQHPERLAREKCLQCFVSRRRERERNVRRELRG